MKRFVAALALLLGLAATARAQVDRATLSGSVKDSTGAVISGATVTVTNVATNVATRVDTTSTGTYLAVNLGPGTYLVEAEAAGFMKVAQSVMLGIGVGGRLCFEVGVGGH